MVFLALHKLNKSNFGFHGYLLNRVDLQAVFLIKVSRGNLKTAFAEAPPRVR